MTKEVFIEKRKKLKEMKRLYEEEHSTLRDIAGKFGMTHQAVHERFVRAGISLRPPGQNFIKNDRQVSTKLYIKEGLTMGEVTDELNLSYTAVRREMERLGIPKQSNSKRRKNLKLNQLKVGETIVIKKPTAKNYGNLHR